MSNREIESIAIIGTGVIGTKIAWACVVNGLTVHLFDVQASQLRRCVKCITDWLLEDGVSISETRMITDRLHCHESLSAAVNHVDLAFENVPELVELKTKVHQEIHEAMQPTALLGSNASSIVVSRMAQASGRPGQFFNMNFTDPRKGQLVEIMIAPETLPGTLAAAESWARKIGMVPIVTRKEIMGYTFNRIWRAIKKESLFLANEGYADPEDIDRAFMMTFGTSIGPFGMMDEVGLNSILRVEENYFAESGDPSDRPPRILTDLVAAGHLGVQSGRGFYTYPGPAYQRPEWLKGDGEK